MISRYLKHAKGSLFLQSLALVIIMFFSQCKESYKIELIESTGTISGRIENYDGVFKSGKLTYFDAIGRIVTNEIFVIDSSGSFNVNFHISHPIYNSTFLEVQGNYYSPFLEPSKDLKVKIIDNSIEYPGDEGLSNKQIILLEDTINTRFKKEIEHCKMLHTTDIKYNDYLQEEIKLSKDKLKFISEFEKTHSFNQSVLNAVKKDAYYAAARSWICFRYDYSTGRPQERKPLFENFYEDLFKEFPINDLSALSSREYIDYISNIKDVFSKSELNGTGIDFIRKSKIFSENELKLIQGLYNSDTSITRSIEFKQFFQVENRNILRELSQRNSFNNVLNSCDNMPRGIGRDLVISQGMSYFYFTDSYIQPTENEWSRVDKLIDTRFVFNYLLDLDNGYKIKAPVINGSSKIPESVRESAKKLSNELIGKYIGKVVYIDFWTVWCGPCREEVPYSKMLEEQFKNQNVVFLYFCCQSNKESWKKLIAQDKLNGEHYLLSKLEYNELSALFEVNAFPTYILIDKKGEIVSKNASRPSSKVTIIKEIQKLLE